MASGPRLDRGQGIFRPLPTLNVGPGEGRVRRPGSEDAKDAMPTRAVILTTQRTGSSFLVECLASHPDIECAREILEGHPDDPKVHLYRGPFRRAVKLYQFLESGAWLPGNRIERYFTGGHAKVRMFKAMYNQLERPFCLRYLRDHEEIRVVHLRRRNLLKLHVSTLLMPKRRELQANTPVDLIRIRVNPAKAIANMRIARARYERFERIFDRHPRLPVTYESLIDGQTLRHETGRRICEFLGVRPRPMRSELVKMNPESLRQVVTNYDELAAQVSRTEFAELLD
jgi:hypothetical protein